MSTETLWYIARGSGAVTLMLLTLVVALGIGQRRGRAFAGMHRLVVASVHRSAALLSVVFLVIHVTTLMFDPYAGLKIINLVVPFTSDYRPLWVGLGAIALDLLVALVVTSLLRDRMSPRVWRAVHWFAYAMWPVALVHGFGSGTDRSTVWMLGIDVVCILSVLSVLVTTHPALRGSGDITAKALPPTNPSAPTHAAPAAPPLLTGSRQLLTGSGRSSS